VTPAFLEAQADALHQGAPLTIGPLADATSLTAALGVVPVLLALAAAGLTLLSRARVRRAAV
jgi:hypothetical protein